MGVIKFDFSQWMCRSLLGVVTSCLLQADVTYGFTTSRLSTTTTATTSTSMDDPGGGGSSGSRTHWTNILSTLIIWLAIIFACFMCCKGFYKDCCHQLLVKPVKRCTRWFRSWPPLVWCCPPGEDGEDYDDDEDGHSNLGYTDEDGVFRISGRFADDPPPYDTALNMPRPPKSEVDDSSEGERIEDFISMRERAGTSNEEDTRQDPQGHHHNEDDVTESNVDNVTRDDDVVNNVINSRHVVRVDIEGAPNATDASSVTGSDDEDLPTYEQALEILARTEQQSQDGNNARTTSESRTQQQDMDTIFEEEISEYSEITPPPPAYDSVEVTT